MKVLFLCTHNSCRSILAEAVLRQLAPPHWQVASAGSQPTGRVHPRTLALLERERIATDGLHSKAWDALPFAPDLVVTVCAGAAGETCPAYLGRAVRAHWGVPDPAAASGSDADIEAAFAQAYRVLRHRVQALLGLPDAVLHGDPDTLQAALADIGTRHGD